MAIKHAFESPAADNGDADEVGPDEWNDPHVVENDTVTYAMIQNVSATDRLLGRSTVGAGDIEEIACTAAGRALLDDADVVEQRGTLGLADIAASGSGADLTAGSVALAKLADLATQRVIGRNTAGSGAPEEVTAGQIFDWVSSTNGVLLTRTGGSWAALGNVTTHGGDLVHANGTPTAPSAGSKSAAVQFAGRQLMGSMGSDGVLHTFQPHIGRTQFVSAQPVPGANNHTVWGSGTWSFTGTATARTITASNNVSCIGRMGVVSAASAGSIAGMRLAVLRFHRGDATGRGGFHLVWHWAITDPVLVADARMFCGLWGSSSAPTDVEPSSLTQLVGIGCDAGDTQLQLYGAAGAAQTRTALGANFPCNTTSTDLYEVSLYSPPNGSYVGWQVTRKNTGHTTQGTITDAAKMPSSTQFLAPHAWRTNNATAAACAFDWWSCLIEATG
jgi:hypothetical protein